MLRLYDQRTRILIAKRRRALSLPHAAKAILNSSITEAKSNKQIRNWCLPETSFPDEVLHYHSRHKALAISGPRPKLRQIVLPEFAEEQAIKIDAGLNFASLAETADHHIKPILLYYACAHLCGVYTRFLFEWDRDNRNHGLSCSHHPGNVSETKVTISNKGQFARLATTCFLLTGMPSCFSTLVTYSTSPMACTEPGGFLENFGKNEKGVPVTAMTLDELLNFDFGRRLQEVRSHFGFHKFKGLPTTAFLIDIIILFVASSLARYDVLGWQQVLDGKNNAYRIQFEEAFERFQRFMVNALLVAFESPFKGFDARFFQTEPSPYSHDDHSRFDKDPNHAC